MGKISYKSFWASLMGLVLLNMMSTTRAQLNPSPSQFYYNEMMHSVAATGSMNTIRLDASFRNMVPNAFNGAPVNQYLTVQSQLASGNGIGVQFSGDNGGLLSRNRVMGSYALDLSKGDTRFRLGVGMGVMMSRINDRNGRLIRGDVNDPAIAEYNQQRMNVDASVGMMLETITGFRLLASIPSLGAIQQFSKYGAINYMVFNSMLKKKIDLGVGGDASFGGMSSIEPMLGYRVIHGGKDIIDMGVLINYQEWIGFMAMCHTNSEFAFGINIPYKDKLAFNFTYNTGKVYSKDYMNVGGGLEGHFVIHFGNKKNK